MSEVEQVEVQQEQHEEHAERDYESEARSQGWVGEEDFRGDKSDWVDAQTFVKRGEQILPILRKNNEKLMQRLQKAEKDAEEARTAAKEFRQFQKDNYERKVSEYESQLAQLRQAKKEAISQGDGDRVVDIDDAIDVIKEQQQEARQEIKKADAPPPPDITADPVLNDWIQKNEWFGKDRKLTAIANGIGEALRAENPSLIGQDFLNKLDEELSSIVGDKGQKKTVHNPVEGRTNTRPTGSKKKSYENLPSDAKAACDKFVRQGLMTKEEYVNEYSWD